jgi:transposase
MLLGLLVYGYATGVHSSRKIERACHDSVAFRFIVANTQLDYDSIASFRRRFLAQIEKLFVQVLALAREMKCLKLSNIGLDGTRIAANASKHKAQVSGKAYLGWFTGLSGTCHRAPGRKLWTAQGKTSTARLDGVRTSRGGT